jgi:hypothetical protein
LRRSSRGLLGEVAALAEALKVGLGGPAIGLPGLGVVDVAERGAAPGGAAQVLVAGLDEVRERGRGEAGAGVEADELSGPGSDVEAAGEADLLGEALTHPLRAEAGD